MAEGLAGVVHLEVNLVLLGCRRLRFRALAHPGMHLHHLQPAWRRSGGKCCHAGTSGRADTSCMSRSAVCVISNRFCAGCAAIKEICSWILCMYFSLDMLLCTSTIPTAAPAFASAMPTDALGDVGRPTAAGGPLLSGGIPKAERGTNNQRGLGRLAL